MEKTIGLWQAIAIAVGSMIGASIFSIFGLGFDLNGIAAITSAVFVVLMIYQWNTNRSAFYATWIAFAVSLMVEIIYRGISRREMVERDIEAVEEALKQRIAHHHGRRR